MAMSLIQLQMLAHERLPSRTHQLLREIAERLCDPAPSADRRVFLEQLLDKVLDEAEPVARQEFAKRLAGRADVPPSVAVRLANDLITIAAPLLTNSPVLQDDDLAMVAAGKSPDHQLAVAMRTQLSARVTDVLIVRGDALVLDCLAQNLGARFSASGAAALVHKAQSRPPLWRRLVARPELAISPSAANADGFVGDLTQPVEVCGTTRILAPAELRHLIVTRLHAAMAPGRPLDELSDLIAAGRLQLCEAVAEIADADRVADLAVLISDRRDFASHDFVRDLFAPDALPLMRRCRAAALGVEGFSAVLRLRRRRLLFEAVEIGPLLRTYRALAGQTSAATPDP
jgi:hypothetical protein